MFNDPQNYLWLIPALPLLASALLALIGIFGHQRLKDKCHWVCIAGAVGSCVLSFATLTSVYNGWGGTTIYGTWFGASSLGVPSERAVVWISLHADGLSAVMLVTVTFIGSLIAIYSAGYMKGDPGYPRYFAVFSLFLFSMTGLVLAHNFILLYAFWEGVGLCSYLLIGFWFAKPSAAAAARKAFLVMRLGDIGLFLGIALLWASFENSPGQHLLEFNDVFKSAEGVFKRVHDLNISQVQREAAQAEYQLLIVACLLLFMGAVGKSAQFPLHIWLPDAMEGPSPVSALIHAATMVTAGVYLLARCMPLFGLVPEAQLVVAVIGGFTALLAALIALTQTDLKRVLAYSTVSQLGFMFLALGSGTRDHKLAVAAAAAAIFHLFTHAFFKALLFLSAGSVMQAMGNVIDMRKFSGLRKVVPITHWTFLCGAAALAGAPLLSGFWSKDEILAVTLDASEGGFAAGVYKLLFFSAMLTAGLTAFYTFRAYFKTFWGPEKIPAEAYAHHHDHSSEHHDKHDPHEVALPVNVTGSRDKPRLESPAIMTVPLCVLAVGAVAAGIVYGPTGLFSYFLQDYWMRISPEMRTAFPAAIFGELTGHHNYVLMVVSGLVVLGGVGLAYLFYVKRPMLPVAAAFRVRRLFDLSRNAFYLDEIFAALFVKPLVGVAYFFRVLDQYVVDGVVDLVGEVPSFVGYLLRPIQNGLVQFYALLMALGLGGFLLAILLR